jgi:hypothetical protein
VPRDRRWTGGIANREWQRGRQAGRVIDHVRLSGDVRRYLADCRAHAAALSAKYHPTEASALKVIHHHGHAEEDVIRGAFRALTGTRPLEAVNG